MKVKRVNKKLALNKVSIANLDNLKIYRVLEELRLIKGGATTSIPTSGSFTCVTIYEPTCQLSTDSILC